MVRPEAIVVFSAHWEDAPISVGAAESLPLIYDFYGFPDAIYRMKYKTPSAKRVHKQISSILASTGPVQQKIQRGLDHGAWIPLKCMFPESDVPVIQVSLPSQDPKTLFRVGKALAPLRKEGVMILASGNLTHNLRKVRFNAGAAVASWAAEFDHWIQDALSRHDVDLLLDYKNKAPAPDLNHPTKEHLTPVFVALGAAMEHGAKTSFPIKGMEYYSISRRCVQWT